MSGAIPLLPYTPLMFCTGRYILRTKVCAVRWISRISMITFISRFIFTKTMWRLRMFWLLHHTEQFVWRNWNWRLACWFSLLLWRIFDAAVVKHDVICYEKLFIAECNSWMLLTSQLQRVEQSKLDMHIRNIERTRRCEKVTCEADSVWLSWTVLLHQFMFWFICCSTGDGPSLQPLSEI
jgi:hypothetical protein